MTDKTDATTYAEKGHKIPENPKARKKSVNSVYEKIEKLKVQYETIKLGYFKQDEIIKKAKEDQAKYKATIEKYKKRKAELEAQVKDLQEIQYDYDELSELRSQKENLEKQVSKLHNEKNDLERAVALLDEIELEDVEEI